MGLAPEVRAGVERFVRPLYAGLDGVQTFDRVGRLARHVADIADIASTGPPGTVDAALLELLLLLHGAADRLGSLAPGGRLDLFLRGLGLADELVRSARSALGRFREDPRSPEERLLHDALLLDAAGVAAVVERLMAAGKKRAPLARAVAQLDPGPPPERYRTPGGAALGAERRKAAEAWIADLRARLAAERAFS